MKLVRIITSKLKQLRKVKFKSKGEGTEINEGSFMGTDNITIGKDVYVGPGAVWYGHGGIEINDNVIIGPKSVIWTVNHNYDSEICLPYDEIDFYKPVVIEKNVWIGFGVKISPGINIGEGSVLAMGSVITKDVPPLSIVGGNPAKIIMSRDEEKYKKITSKEDFHYLSRKRKGIQKKIVKNQIREL